MEIFSHVGAVLKRIYSSTKYEYSYTRENTQTMGNHLFSQYGSITDGIVQSLVVKSSMIHSESRFSFWGGGWCGGGCFMLNARAGGRLNQGLLDDLSELSGLLQLENLLGGAQILAVDKHVGSHAVVRDVSE